MEMALSIPCGVLKEYRRKRLKFSRGIQLRKNELPYWDNLESIINEIYMEDKYRDVDCI